MKYAITALFTVMLMTPVAAKAETAHQHDEKPQGDKHHHDHHRGHHHDHHEAHHEDHREHSAHVHGIARLTLAMQGTTLEIMLESPADSLFGFEHAPATPEEQARADKVLAQLKDSRLLFNVAEKAGCATTRTEIDAPFVQAGKGASEGHADVSATYVLECKQPQKLTTLSLPMFSTFPALRKLTVDYVTDSKQGSQTLTPQQTTMTLQ